MRWVGLVWLAAAAPLAAFAAGPGAGGPGAADLEAWRVKLEAHLKQEILGFWLAHAVDRVHGGFYGAVNRECVPDPAAAKSLVMESRVVWTFAAAYERFHDPAYRAAAQHAFAFLAAKFRDPSRGGWFWSVSADGSPLDLHKQVYGESFALYALSTYGRVFRDPAALALARETFTALERHAHDAAHGGYGESFRRDWSPETDPAASPVGPPDEKSMNSHLHLMESMAAFVRATHDPAGVARLTELYGLMLDKIVSLPTGYEIMDFQRDWTPVPGGSSYGHDVEDAWLLLETCDVLGGARRADAERAAKALVDHALHYGEDADRGGLFEEGPVTGPATKRTKAWWAQAEAMTGFVAVWEFTRDPRYWAAFDRTAAFILRDVADPQYGEWYEEIGVDGKPAGDLKKAHAWKGPYHNGRACLEVTGRLADALKKATP